MVLESERSFYMAWYLSGFTSVLLPLLIFGAARLSSRSNGDTNDDQQSTGDDAQNSEYVKCKWWQIGGCSSWAGGGNNDDSIEPQAPFWWPFGRHSDPNRRHNTSAGLIFAYLWALALFAVLLYYGAKGVRNRHEKTVIVSLMVFANLAFISLFLLGGAEGVVEVGGSNLEEDGWYGQIGVLIFLTNLFWIFFALAFICLIRNRSNALYVTKIEIDYYNMCSIDTTTSVDKDSLSPRLAQPTI